MALFIAFIIVIPISLLFIFIKGDLDVANRKRVRSASSNLLDEETKNQLSIIKQNGERWVLTFNKLAEMKTGLTTPIEEREEHYCTLSSGHRITFYMVRDQFSNLRRNINISLNEEGSKLSTEMIRAVTAELGFTGIYGSKNITTIVEERHGVIDIKEPLSLKGMNELY